MSTKTDTNRAVGAADEPDSRRVMCRELGFARRLKVRVVGGHGDEGFMKQSRSCLLPLFLLKNRQSKKDRVSQWQGKWRRRTTLSLATERMVVRYFLIGRHKLLDKEGSRVALIEMIGYLP